MEKKRISEDEFIKSVNRMLGNSTRHMSTKLTPIQESKLRFYYKNGITPQPGLQEQKFVDFKPRNWKYPIIVEMNNAKYKISIDRMLNLIEYKKFNLLYEKYLLKNTLLELF